MKQRRALSIILSIVMALMTVFPASAATGYSTLWKQAANGKWFVQKNDGTMLKKCWFCDDTDPSNVKWYAIGEDGYLIDAPLIQDKNGTYYSMETAHNGSYGMMRNKSGAYDGINIVINETHNGTYGAITNQSAIDALKKKYGVVKIDIDNSGISYASVLTKNSSSGGSSSGGSSSGSTPVTKVDITVPSTPGTYRYGAATLVVTADSVTYTNHSGIAQEAKITSSGKTVTIDSPLDEIRHYGTAESIIIKAVADASYYGNANADSLEAECGHICINSQIDDLIINATKDMDIDINASGVVPDIEIDAEGDNAIDLTIAGDVQTVESYTGNLKFTVEPTAKQTPKLSFVGEEAVAAYERRINDMLEKQDSFPVYLTYNGTTETYQCGVKHTQNLGTEVIEKQIEGKVYNGDVVVDGDFGKIRFNSCIFNGDIINRGNEQTVVQFFNCTFASESECRLENNGREITVNDLVSKFMFMFQKPVNVECDDSSNGSALVIGLADPVKYNDVEHSIYDTTTFVDQRPNAYTTAIQAYEGQPVSINYYGEFNSVDKRETIVLSTFDADIPYALRAYIKINEDRIDYDPNVSKSLTETFTFATASTASPSSGKYEDPVLINAPYNTVTFDGFKFDETVSVKGLYATVKFKNCDMSGKTVQLLSPEITIEFIDCTNVADPSTCDDNMEVLIADGPIEE